MLALVARGRMISPHEYRAQGSSINYNSA